MKTKWKNKDRQRKIRKEKAKKGKRKKQQDKLIFKKLKKGSSKNANGLRHFLHSK